jgi:hypothetical protein
MDEVNAFDTYVTKIDRHGLMSQVTAELKAIAATVDRIADAYPPTVELLEASHAVQTALVLLNDWSSV